MSKPLPDKAELALEYPDKLYIGRSIARRGLTRTSIRRVCH
jgi:hypothetical protein